MRFRNIVFTLNNYSEDEYNSILNNTLWSWVIIGKEMGESGTAHLQGYGVLSKQMSNGPIKTNINNRMHYEARRGSHQQAKEYCKKDGQWEEKGVEPKQGERTDIKKAAECIRSEGVKRCAEEYPVEFIKYNRGLILYESLFIEPYNHDSVRGEWFVGPPGTGKSRDARARDVNAYIKAQNKWWDGYKGEETVILDDLDTGALGHYLKIWADRYSCTGEVKGGTVQLRHKVFIVTSNYTIEQLWPDSVEMQEAITRRFNVTEY